MESVVVAALRRLLARGVRSRGFVLAAIALITAVSCAALPFLRFDGRIDIMLPDRSELRGIFEFLREIQVADKVLVTFSMRDGSSAPAAVIAAADLYVAGLDPALAVPLNTGVQTDSVARDFARLTRQLPDYVSAADLARLEADTSLEGLRASLQALKNRLQTPEGLFGASAARSDPLDWNGRAIRNILETVASFGYRAALVQNHLMDPERRHVLVVLQTPVPMTDTAGGRRLLDHLEARAADLPPAVEARLVCGHLHTSGNEAVIRRDIRITGFAITAVFLALFLGVYRDGRALGIMLIPFLASVPALAGAASLFDSFSFIVIGFGSVIAGIAVDYGIHTYVAARSENPERNLALIRMPVALSALTTLCVFVAFCFSGIPAYRQLGVFAAIAILVSLGYAFWALPLFVRKRREVAEDAAFEASRLTPGPTGPHARLRARLVVGLSLLGLLAGGGLVFRLKMEPDVSKLDGTPQATLDEETRAMTIWGGGESRAAILCVDAPDEKEALRRNDRLYAGLLAAGLDASDISSLAPICPSDETRQARRKAWRAFWTEARVEGLRENMTKEGAPLDFSEQAFLPFFDLLDEWTRAAPELAPEPIGFLAPLHDRFVHPQAGKTRVTTFVPDEPRFLAAAQELQRTIPSLQVISRQAFSADLSRTIIREVTRISLLAGFFILLVSGLMIRRAGMLLLAAIPALAGMVWGGAGMALAGQPLNISNLIAGIIVLGLCIDYGICMAYAHRRGMRRDVFRAVTLSALTTALGAGVLLLARHPAFLSIGVTLVFGVSAGYLYAWLVLPAMQTLWPRLNPPADDARGAGRKERA